MIVIVPYTLVLQAPGSAHVALVESVGGELAARCSDSPSALLPSVAVVPRTPTSKGQVLGTGVIDLTTDSDGPALEPVSLATVANMCPLVPPVDNRPTYIGGNEEGLFSGLYPVFQNFRKRRKIFYRLYQIPSFP